MNGEIKNFYESEMKCSATVIDWIELDKLNSKANDFFDYLGNYMDDDSTTVYAMFADDSYDRKKYVVKID